MSINCSSLSDVLTLAVENHTIVLENRKDLVITDCQGVEVFRCDLALNQINMEVRETAQNFHEIVLGSPQALPIDGSVFTREINLDEPGASVVFGKEIRFKDIEYIGTHEILYDCVVATPPPPSNGIMEYRYRLSEVRIGLHVNGSIIEMIAPCSTTPCDPSGNPGFRESMWLKST